MPLNKEALIRYRIIDSCLRNRQHQFPTLEFLVQACEEKLGKPFSSSTIQKDIYTMRFDDALGFRAPVEYSKKHHGYYYTDQNFTLASIPLSEQDIEAMEFAVSLLQQFRGVKILEQFESSVDKILEAIHIQRALAGREATEFIQVEKADKQSGTEWLGEIVSAIINQIPVEITYQPFVSEKSKQHLVHPYLLKEYRNRWYLVGMIDQYNLLSTFGLDRITELSVSEKSFRTNREFNPDAYFKHAFGITTFEGKPKQVVLSFTPLQGKYIKTQPLHPTQIILIDNKKELRVSIHVGITIELIMAILSYGEKVKVIKPVKLAADIKAAHSKALGRY